MYRRHSGRPTDAAARRPRPACATRPTRRRVNLPRSTKTIDGPPRSALRTRATGRTSLTRCRIRRCRLRSGRRAVPSLRAPTPGQSARRGRANRRGCSRPADSRLAESPSRDSQSPDSPSPDSPSPDSPSADSRPADSRLVDLHRHPHPHRQRPAPPRVRELGAQDALTLRDHPQRAVLAFTHRRDRLVDPLDAAFVNPGAASQPQRRDAFDQADVDAGGSVRER